MKNYCLPTLLALFIFVSCKKTPNEPLAPQPSHITQQSNVNDVEFAKTLARALTDKEVRSLIRQEAIRMFDKDYDVLYGFSKEVTGSNGKTLHEQIAAYAKDKQAFNELVNATPLLTIYVPQLENFDAAKWDTDKQAPIVAVRNLDDKQNGRPLLAYDADGNEIKLSYSVKPDRPLVVVKENERVLVENSSLQNNAGRTTSSAAFGRGPAGNYVFISDDYNGLKPAPQTERSSPLNLIDPRVITAFDKGINPQRDYIYYGIDPAQGINEGLLKTNYAEFISGIKINDIGSRSYIIDDDITDGMLEFQVNIFFLQNSGNAGSLLKVFSCDPAKLFMTARNVNGQLETYPIDYALPSPIEITDWDMENYGNTWKFQITEYDPGTTVTKTTTVTSTFGTNYGININFDLFKKVKIGLNFGVSNTTTKTETTTYTVTGTSDNLGEALLDYSAPILLQKTSGSRPGSSAGLIRGINTGTVTLDVETRQRY